VTVVARDSFRAVFGREPQGIWSAPGRVNLIGEFTDYNEGFVLPFALSLRTAVAVARRHDGLLRISSGQQPGPPVSAPVATLAPGSVQGWSAYVAGVVWSLRTAGHDVGGMDLAVNGEVPPGSGLSSSAAIECATALALADIYHLDIAPTGLAAQARTAENDFVGVPSGPMDQMVSMLAVAGHAMFLDTRSGRIEHIPFDPGAAGCRLVVVDTRVRHAHAEGAYSERRRNCTSAAERLKVAALRDISEDGMAKVCRVLADDPVLIQRVRHVVTENARTVRIADLLRAGRLTDIGSLLSASHKSLRDDFQASSPELDAVVDAAERAGALGARMTGGGFGGCAIVLVANDCCPAVIAAISAASKARGFPAPSYMSAVPSAGAHKEAGLSAH
jgi:galactokinase